MGLNERQTKVIELYTQGTPIIDIARIVGCSRPTVYSDLENPEVKAGVARCLADIKTQVEKKVVNKLNSYVDELHKIALTSKSEKTRLDALQYLTDRGLGKATSKVNVTTTDKGTDNIDDDVINEVLDEDEEQEVE